MLNKIQKRINEEVLLIISKPELCLDDYNILSAERTRLVDMQEDSFRNTLLKMSERMCNAYEPSKYDDKYKLEQ